jgi:uncharacterized protein (DUF433 family)
MVGKPIVKVTRPTVAFALKKISETASADDIILAYPNLAHFYQRRFSLKLFP